MTEWEYVEDMTNATTYEDMLEAFVDASASAGLKPVDTDERDCPNWIGQQGWDAYRCNGGDSYTIARFIPGDERMDLLFTTPTGVIIAEHSFRFSRLDVLLFETCASCYP